MKWTYRCLLVAIALLPWYIVRWQVAGIPTTLLELSVVLTLVVGLVEWSRISGGRVDLLAMVRAYKWWLVWSLVFLAACVVAVFVSPDRRQAMGAFKAYIVEPMVLGWLMVKVVGDDRRRWWGIVIALLVAGMEVVVVGISQFIVGWPNLAPAELAQGRISSFYNSANRIGLFLGPLIGILSAAVIGLQHHKTYRRLLLVVLLAMLLVVLLSRSRGALLGVAIVELALLAGWLLQRWSSRLLFYKQWWRMGLLAGLAVYVVASVGYVWFINNPPIVANPYTRPGFTTLTVRQCLWQGTKAMLSQQPIFGAGLAGFTTNYLKHVTCDAEPLEDPHMLVLNFWSETGLAGSLAMLSLMVLWGWGGYKLMLVEGTARWIGIGLVLALLYYLVHGLDDIPYFRNDLSMEWWLLIGLVVASQRVWLSHTTEV